MNDEIHTEKRTMRVPYALSVHGKPEIEAVVRVLEANTAVGENTKEFEKKIAALFGKKYGCMVNSGSSANLLAFELLNLPRGSEVITPLLTFATVVAPIVQKGLIPVFIDVEPDTYLIDIEKIEAAISEKTKVLMIPSLLGNIPNLERLQEIAKKHNLYLIEDSCDTLGASFKNRPTGEYSDISVTSFYGSHIINGAGGGGMICVNNPEWAERLVVLRGWGRRSSLFGERADSEQIQNRFKSTLAGVPYDEKFTFSEIGYNFLPLEISAAFALEQLHRFPGFAAARVKNFFTLHHFFAGFSEFFELPRQTTNAHTPWLAFPVIIKESAPFTRHDIVTFLESAGIQTRPVFTGDVLQHPGFAGIEKRLGQDSFPNTTRIMKQAFVLGIHQGLTEEQIRYVTEQVQQFLLSFVSDAKKQVMPSMITE